MSALQAVVYVSSAQHFWSQEEIDELLLKSRQRNLREDLTGVLMYREGNVMQYLEGPREALQRVWRSILVDPLHHRVQELTNEPIAQREFADWRMAFSRDTTPLFLRQQPPGSPVETGMGKSLLQTIWSQTYQRGR